MRQEIELGIAQIDFEISTDMSGQAWRFAALICLAATLMSWEMGRLNGERQIWSVVWTVALVAATFVVLVPASRQAIKQGLQRRRVLEGLLVKLDENPAG